MFTAYFLRIIEEYKEGTDFIIKRLAVVDNIELDSSFKKQYENYRKLLGRLPTEEEINRFIKYESKLY